MQGYDELLKITEDIEQALLNNNFAALAFFQKERQELFSRLPIGSISEQPEKIEELIQSIRNSEDRCIILMRAGKKLLIDRMGTVGRAKKLQNAYLRQALA